MLYEVQDGHDDLPIGIRAFYHNNIYSDNFTFDKGLVGHVDIPRLHEGRVGVRYLFLRTV